jgi:FlaG/FlaF family flagellin (archaellin)
MSNKIFSNKKGVSMIIGYILLVAISIVMSIIVYQWLKTYVPSEGIKCDEGTSIYIRSIDYNCSEGKLTIYLKNNGKFSIYGVLVRVSNKTEEELATIDLSQKVLQGGIVYTNTISFTENFENGLSPAEEKGISFNVSEYGLLYKLEVIPVRIQEVKNKKVSAICTDGRAQESLTCD